MMKGPKNTTIDISSDPYFSEVGFIQLMSISDSQLAFCDGAVKHYQHVYQNTIRCMEDNVAADKAMSTIVNNLNIALKAISDTAGSHVYKRQIEFLKNYIGNALRIKQANNQAAASAVNNNSDSDDDMPRLPAAVVVVNSQTEALALSDKRPTSCVNLATSALLVWDSTKDVTTAIKEHNTQKNNTNAKVYNSTNIQ